MVICLERGVNDLHYGPADATATRSSLVSLKSKWFNLFGAGLSRLSWNKRPLNGCLSVCTSGTRDHVTV